MRDSQVKYSLNLFVLYIGVALLMTHELDAVMNNEWLVLPLTSWLEPDAGYLVFLWMHVPLFALLIYVLSHSSKKVRLISARVLAGFLVIHGALHLGFSGHEHYEFSTLSSSLLIYGGSVFGVAYFVLDRFARTLGRG